MWLHQTIKGMISTVALICIAVMPLAQASADAGVEPYVGFHKQTTVGDFMGSTLNGVVISKVNGKPAGPPPHGCSPGKPETVPTPRHRGINCKPVDIHLADNGLMTGNNQELYGVDNYSYGTLESSVFDSTHPFDTAISSWNAQTPENTWVQIELRAYRPTDEHWTKYYIMGIWTSRNEGQIVRHSVASQGDSDGFVATDTLLLYGQPVYTKYQYRLTLFTTDPNVSPSVSLMSVMTSNSYRETEGLDIPSDHEAWGIDLSVPQRSQMIYPDGGEVWCSPTSTSMVLAYWGHSVPVPYAAASTYDSVYDGTGNWPFNTAWASTYGMTAYVTRMGSMSQIEEWIKAGIPVVISLAWNNNDPDETLPGAAIPSSGGHLMVVRGFDADGNVIANDPAFPSDDSVRVVYDRATLQKLWLEHSGGTVYLIYPKGHPIPTQNVEDSW